MAFRKIEAGLVHAPVDEFIGKTGTIFYDNDLGDFRISDGQTPGGIALSFGGGGGDYTLPTATTTVKGGVKIDGTTIAITNQVIRVGTVPYSSLSGTPTIPTNNNQLTNGAAYITSSALSGYATESYVTTRGYLTTVAYADVTGKPTLFSGSYADLTNKPTLFSGSYADLTNKPTIPTNNNELTNGAAYITSAALSGLASETYVTTRGYITSAALSTYALSSSIPTDISQLTDTQSLLGQGGGGGGTTYITNTVENPFSFSIAGDDSTLREISNGESIKITGAGGITVTTDAEGAVTVTGTPVSLAGYATESYVNSRGYITGLSWNQLTDKPNLAGTYTFNVAADDSTLRTIGTEETVKFVGAGGITTASDAEGAITITQGTTSSLVNGSYTVGLSSAGVLTVPANGIITAPNAQEFQLQAKAADSVLRNEINLDPNNGTYMSVWSEELSTSFSLGAGSWVTGSWQKPGGFGAAYFTGAQDLQDFWTTGPGSFVDSVEVSINGGARGRAGYEGNNGGGSGVELSVDRIPVSSPTAITSLVFYYRTKNRFDIDYLNGQMLLNTQSMNINLETNSYINLKSTRANPVRIITNNNTHIWEFAANGKLTLPNGSTIGDGEAGFGVPITTARGTILLGNLAECAGGENHFHIMPAGQQAIDLFLGDDSNYVKLPSTGGVEISSSEIGSQHYWTFGSDGDLTVPGDIKSTANTSIIIDGGVLLANVTVQSVDSFGGGVWRMFISSSAYPTLGTIVQVGDTATLAWNNSVTATITSIVQDIGAGTWALHSNQNLITGWYGNPDARTTTINSTQIKTWTFGTDRRLILPVGGDILDSTGTSVLAGSTSSLVNGAYILSLGSTGTVTFPDDTVQNTAWTGVADYNNLINKPNLAGTYQFSEAADDSTQRLISTDETVKFIGAGGITTASDDEGKITITQGTTSSLVNSTKTVSLGSDGVLTLPANGRISAASGYNLILGDGLLLGQGGSIFNENEDGLYLGGQNSDAGTYIQIPGRTASENGEPLIISHQWDGAIDIQGGGGTWSFGTGGTLSLPNNGKISSGVNIAQVGSSFAYATDAFGSLYDTGLVALPADTNSNAVVAGYTIVSNTGVTLTVTSATFVAGSPNFVQVATTPTASSFAYPVTVYSADYVAGYTAPEWQFGTNGSLTFPNGTTQTTAAESFSFSVAADDSTQRAISNNELVKFIGAGGITTSSDAEGAITITGPSLAGLATETFVTTRGYITGLSWDQLTNKPNLAGTYSWSIAADDSTQVEVSAGNLVKIRGAGGITTASDAEGNITITGSAPDRLTSNSRSAVLNTNGTFSLPTLTATPSSPQAGQMALANGTSWDPIAQNNGAPYMVIYTGSAWIGMGGVTVDKVYEMILEMG